MILVSQADRGSVPYHMEKRERFSKFHVGSKYWTLPANPYLSAPAMLNLPPTDGPIDEPAEVSRFEFPRRALLTGWRRTAPNFPAGPQSFIGLFFKGPQEEHLPFYVHRDSSPPLFEALNAPERRSQELRHFLLSFLKFLTKQMEFFGVHGFLLLDHKNFLCRGKFFLDSIYHTVLQRQPLFHFSFLVATA